MPLPGPFGKNVSSGQGASFLSRAPALMAGGQMAMFLMSLDTFDTVSRLGALAEILAKTTSFKGRFIDDIFVLLFTRPSPLAKKAGLIASAATGLASIGAGAIGPIDIASLLPNFFAFVFRINPTKHERTQTRSKSTVLTKGGYLTQYWASGMKQMTFTGSSGSLLPPGQDVNTEGFNIRQTAQYANFLNLRRFYEEANQDVAIFFLGRFMVGVMSEFIFTEDAEKPYEITYNFKFDAYPEFRELA